MGRVKLRENDRFSAVFHKLQVCIIFIKIGNLLITVCLSSEIFKHTEAANRGVL